jgi:hypothetical protein
MQSWWSIPIDAPRGERPLLRVPIAPAALVETAHGALWSAGGRRPVGCVVTGLREVRIVDGHRVARQAWWFLVLVSVVVLGLAGCGRGDVREAPTPTGPEATTPQPSEAATVQVDVFLTNDRLGDPCSEVFAVSRRVAVDDPITGAMEALLAGPMQAEEARGFDGWFSDRTAGMLLSVRVGGGVARVDFNDLASVIPSASSSCGSAALLAQLDTTLLQFPEVEATRYSINGDVDAFYEWLQRGAPEAPTAGDENGADDEPAPDTDDGDEPAAVLEDGRHATLLHGLDIDGRTITVDVVQFLTGQEAIDVYRRDYPDEPLGPPNDCYVVNANPRLRTLPVADGVTVRVVRLGESTGANPSPGTWEELPSHLARNTPDDPDLLSYSPFWITVDDGRVTAIEEQYTP